MEIIYVTEVNMDGDYMSEVNMDEDYVTEVNMDGDFIYVTEVNMDGDYICHRGQHGWRLYMSQRSTWMEI